MMRKSLLALGVILCLASLPALAQSIPTWQPNTAYTVGALVTYNGIEYKCIQAHTSQVGWEPPNTPALWQPVNGSPSPTPTPTPSPSPTPTPTPSPIPTPTGGSCAAPWNATTAYTGGMVASVGSNNYTAAFWTQNQNPTVAGNSGPAGSGAPWSLPVSCAAPTPTPAPKPTPTPSPTPTPPGNLPANFIFAAFKDVTVNANFNTGAQQSAVSGTVQPVTNVLPANTPEVWSFATGTCGSESWAGISVAMEASNVQAFVNAGKKYVISTGGASGQFDCPSGQALINFINTYNSANLIGIDFDIEDGQSQQVIDDLINATKAAEAQFPNLQFSFTIPTLGGTSNPITVAGEPGTLVVSEIQRLGLGGNYVIDLEAMDYGSANTTNCVVVNGQCEMGQSAVNAAQALHVQTGIPYNHIGIVVDIGQNDSQGEVFKLADVDTITAFAKSNGLGTVRFWSFDRDTPGNPACAVTTDSPSCNGTGDAALAFTNRFLQDLGLK